MKNIVFLDSYSIAGTSIESIEALGNLTTYEDTAQSEVIERCKDAEIVITNKVKIFKEELDNLPKLELICVAATGTNNVDTEHAKSLGVEVKNVAGYSSQSVTEATFSLVLGLLRQVPFYNDFVQSGKYAEGTRCFNLDREISEIRGKRWGIIGMGAIGRGVAAVATAFGAEVCYYSTSGNNLAQDYPSLSLEELLQSSDIVSIHAPLNDKTYGLISTKEFGMMKPSAIIVNVGRGGIINEEALCAALNNNQIAGAGLDVFENEPLKQGNGFASLNDPYKLIAAPHCGWSSSEARDVLVEGIAKNIKEKYL